MARMTRSEALALAARHRIPMGKIFHALCHDDVASVLVAAEERRYRTPRNANGSRGRYFYEHLQRAAARAD